MKSLPAPKQFGVPFELSLPMQLSREEFLKRYPNLVLPTWIDDPPEYQSGSLAGLGFDWYPATEEETLP